MDRVEGNGEVLVTVWCITYNHEAYIKDALEGFVSQETTFPFEVLIHDDASTDGTADIIREYAERYPDIIRPILQTQNAYSRGIPIMKTFLWPKTRGRFVAMCEGDDYWTDPHKLQRQADWLLAHDDCIACCHDYMFFDMKTGKGRPNNGSMPECDLSIESVGNVAKRFYQTATLMRRKEYCNPDPLPYMDLVPGVGDYQQRIYLLLSGKIHYFPQVMSVYRFNVPGSWTARNQASQQKYIENEANVIKMLDAADEYTGGAYHEAFERAKLVSEYEMLNVQGRFAEMLDPRFDEARSMRSKAHRIKASIGGHVPLLAGCMRRLAERRMQRAAR